MPLHNALGLKYWPQHVQDEQERLRAPKWFIPIEDLQIAGLDGRPVLDLFDAINHGIADLDDIVPMEFDYDQERETWQAWLDNFTEEKVKAHYRSLYPELFYGVSVDQDVEPEEGDYQPKFHGVTRQNVTPGKITTRRPSKPNVKKKLRKCHDRKNIREYHFNEWFATDQELEACPFDATI